MGVACEGPVCLEWQRKANDATEWQDVSSESRYKGQGTPSLEIVDVEEEDEAMFRCRVSSVGGAISTKEAPLLIG